MYNVAWIEYICAKTMSTDDTFSALSSEAPRCHSKRMFGIAPEMQAGAEIVHLKGCTQTMCWHTNSCNIAPGALSSPLCIQIILENANHVISDSFMYCFLGLF